jgi:predicted O-methyltransferase YrrM
VLTAQELHRRVGRPEDMTLDQWESLAEAVAAYRPDLVVELGRGYGNSTALFTDAASRNGGRVVSVGYDGERAWTTVTVPKLQRHVPPGWFDRLQVIEADITTFDFGSVIRSGERVTVFWDAHGAEVADAILHRLLPLTGAGTLVLVHDMAESAGRVSDGLFIAGPLASTFDEVIPLWQAIESRGLEWQVHPSGWLRFIWA